MDGLMSPFQARILLHQSACFEKEEVELLLNNLRWADLNLKTTQINPKHILEEALMASFARKRLASFEGKL
jgi:hypothetical protein